jgi:hypothetical protein
MNAKNNRKFLEVWPLIAIRLWMIVLFGLLLLAINDHPTLKPASGLNGYPGDRVLVGQAKYFAGSQSAGKGISIMR